MKEKLTIASLILILLGLPLAYLGWRAWTSAQETAKHSAVAAFMAEMERRANDYYDEFGSFPRSIDEMGVTEFPDGGDETLLDEIRYETDGATMTLEWGELRVRLPDAAGLDGQPRENAIKQELRGQRAHRFNVIDLPF